MDANCDPGYLRFRRKSIRVGSVMALAAATMVAAYALSTWDERPHRGPILALLGVVLASVAVIHLARAERLVDTRWRDVFFFGWSTSYVLVISGLALCDGGTSSPLAITFFPVLVFAGLFYPLGLAAYVGSMCVAAYAGLGLTTSSDGAGSPLYVAGVLVLTAIMCVWQARTLDGQRRELAVASRTDHLTGSLNRRGFHERLEAELSRAARLDEPVAVVLVDLDGFKSINDRFGHAAGDELLCWVVDRLRGELRPTDDLARLGGDEFALLLPGIAGPVAREVVERMRTQLAERTSASFGVSAFPGQASVEQLLAHADAELYTEKPRARMLPLPVVPLPDGSSA